MKTKERIINMDEGTMLGMQLIQRKVVRAEYRRWKKASHPFAIVLDCFVIYVIYWIGVVALLRGMYTAELIVLLLLIVWMVIQLYYRRQYNKQAPSGLKLE